MKKKNNLKRFIAGLVSSAMVMASFVFPVETVRADGDTIDMDAPVLLTIHKYEHTIQVGVDQVGNGGVINIGDEDKYKNPLNDVTFTVYKVAEIDQNTVGGVNIKYNTVASLKDIVDDTVEWNEVETIANSNVLGSLEKWVGKTDGEGNDKGKVVFGTNVGDNDKVLDGVGLYLVVETDYPDKVTNASAPFLVSLPTTIDGEWKYDVHAYPKNSTATNTVIIKKLEKIADEGANVSDDTVEFILQKKESDGDIWNAVTTNSNGDSIVGTSGNIEVVGTKTIDALPHGDYRLIEVLSTNAEHIVESDVVYEFNISSTNGTLSTTDDDTIIEGNIITITNDKPTIKKEVMNAAGGFEDYTDYSTGDEIEFKVSVSIPDSIGKLDTFKIVDTFDPKQFEIVDNTFNYTLFTGAGENRKSLGEDVNDANDDLKLSNEQSLWEIESNKVDEDSWTMTIDDTNRTLLSTNNITAIEITFKAKLLNSAVTATTGNVNTATLTYTNHLYGQDLPVTGSNTTNYIFDTAKVYTFGLEIKTEFEGSDTNTKIATFALYKENLVSGATTIKVGDTEKKVDVVLGTIVVTENGTKTVTTGGYDDNRGLSNGTYYLVETDTEEGYNLLKEPVKIVINVAYDKNGVDNNYITASITVVNKKGFSFPITGGRGTIIFTITGLTLMIVAVCIFFTSRKRKIS